MLDWIEHHCVVPDGFRKGAPFKLYSYQGTFLANFYLVRGDAEWHPQNPVLGSAFVFRTALQVGPQKVGKNPGGAAQICAEGTGPVLFAGWAGRDEGYVCAEHGCRCGWEYPYDPGEPKGMSWPTPLIQITAFSEDSTGNTYDALRPMIEGGPLNDLIPKTGEEFIRLPGGGRIDTVTSSSRSRLGNPITYADEDELGLWTPQAKMVKLSDTQYRNAAGMGGRITGRTNAWDPAEDSVAKRLWESPSRDIYRQFVQPPKDLSFGNKEERRKILRLVYPSDTWRENGGHVDLASISAEAADLAERDPAQAARFFGNMLVAGAGVAVDALRWEDLKRAVPFEPVLTDDGTVVYGPPRGTQIGLGFDGSIYRDDTCLRGCTAEGYGFSIGQWSRPRGSAMEAWQREHPGEEWSVPRREVMQRVAWARTFYRVGRFFADPPRWWDEIDTWRTDFGIGPDDKPIVLNFDTNQPKRMAPAVDRWRTAIAEGTHTHDGNATTAAHVKAAHLKKVHLADGEEDDTQYVVVKGADKRPIDDAIADILAYDAAMTMPVLVVVPKEVLIAWR